MPMLAFMITSLLVPFRQKLSSRSIFLKNPKLERIFKARVATISFFNGDPSFWNFKVSKQIQDDSSDQMTGHDR